MDFDKINELVQIIGTVGVEKFEFKCDEISISIIKSTKSCCDMDKIVSLETKGESESSKFILAPLVGKFYSTPSEGEKPYVVEGEQIKRGDVVGTIEAMKIINEIKSDYEGVIKRIYVSNDEKVEYGQILLEIM